MQRLTHSSALQLCLHNSSFFLPLLPPQYPHLLSWHHFSNKVRNLLVCFLPHRFPVPLGCLQDGHIFLPAKLARLMIIISFYLYVFSRAGEGGGVNQQPHPIPPAPPSIHSRK